MDNAKRKAISLLQKEREDMINCYWGGIDGNINDYSECKVWGDKYTKQGQGANLFFNQSFTQYQP